MLFLAALSLLQEPVTLAPGLVLDSSTKVKEGVYQLQNGDDEGKTSVIQVKGNGITVDFAGATLLGSDWDTAPDKRKGTAVIVEGNNVTIKNLKAHGYKIGLIARNSTGLSLQNCDFSYNWKQHLGSTLDKEDLGDWMSYHQNEKDEWLRYGAGIYLRGCNNFEVKGCRIIGGQCGLMITECSEGKIWNNSFSFLSAIGLGMYRSSNNRVMHNNIDWCVRGYSHTKWNRGQDSAGILIYEQSNKNTFAYNSVTHGGDGFFLWAGQTTMDTGQGGCNDNLLYGNDFSHAPTNGIEATFCRNKFVNNMVLECWHGIWGGYSFDSLVLGNIFAHNAESIAWEHGQNNSVHSNLFYNDTSGLVIWMNKSQDPNWGYPKNKDTSSHGWSIRDNEFQSIGRIAISFRDTKTMKLSGNAFADCGSVVALAGETPDLTFYGNTVWVASAASVPQGEANKVFTKDSYKPMPSTMRGDGNNIESGASTEAYLERFNLIWAPYPKDEKPTRGDNNDKFVDRYYKETRPMAPAPLAGGKRPFLKPGMMRGRRYIMVDEWGPYDFKSPLLWPRSEAGGKLKLEILGPSGKWKVVKKTGIQSVSKETGEVPGEIEVTLPAGQANQIELTLEYTGGDVVTPWGKRIPAGTAYPFSFSRFFAPIDWEVSFFDWSKNTVADPKGAMPPLSALNLGDPVKTLRTDRLDYASGGAFVEGAPANQFATIANGTFTIPEGDYELRVTTDDGIRVWVDDRLVISDAWKYQGPTPYSATLHLGGQHRIRVEHYEIDGYSALKVDLVPKR